MKKFVVALSAAAAFAVLPSFALAAPAADPQATAAVKAMLDAMEIRKNMVAMSAEMQKAMPAILRQQAIGLIQADPKLNAEQKKEAVARFERTLPGVSQAVHRIFSDPALIDEMIAEMVPLYASNYTVAELKQLTAFYQTPVGRKMMALTPKLASEAMASSQRVVMPRLGRLLNDMMQDAQQP
jgi:hypothetical protein